MKLFLGTPVSLVLYKTRFPLTSLEKPPLAAIPNIPGGCQEEVAELCVRGSGEGPLADMDGPSSAWIRVLCCLPVAHVSLTGCGKDVFQSQTGFPSWECKCSFPALLQSTTPHYSGIGRVL